MRKMYTQTLKANLLGLALFFVGLASLNAQVTFEVTAPSALAGTTIQCAHASFGSFIDGTATEGEFVVFDVLEACQPITADLTDKIVFILDPIADSCDNSEMVYNAQVAGAKALVMGHAADRTLQFVSAAGAFASDVTIPVISMLESDYDPLLQVVASGETMMASISMVDEIGDATVVYHETFGGGLGNWVSEAPVEPDSQWAWTADGSGNGSVFFVNSPSGRTDGAAIFDGFYFNRDVTVQPYPNYTGTLTSPSIDVSDHEVLYLTFYQSNWGLNQRNFPLPQTGFEFSTDDGNSWSAIQEVESENVLTSVDGNEVHTEFVRILLEGLNFTENLRLRFTYDGDYYVWIIDDVRLSVPPLEELAIENSFYPLLHFATPEAHIGTDTMGFSVNILNGGLNDQMGYIAKVEVLDASDNVMYSQEETLNLASFERDTVVFPSWGPILTPGDYRLVYTLNNPAVMDEFPGNNVNSFPFVITEDQFGQEHAAQADVIRFITGNAARYYFGGTFTTSTASPDCGIFNGVQLALGASDGVLDTESFALYLLKWIGDGNDGYPQYTAELNMDGVGPIDHPNFEVTALTLFDASAHSLGQNELFELLMSDNVWADGDGIPITELTLEPGTYALVGEFNGNAIGFSAVDEQDLAGVPTILYNYGSDDSWSPGFVNNAFPVLRANVSCLVGTNDPQLEDAVARVFPTLTADQINVEMNFDVQTDVHIIITDMNGRVNAFVPVGEVTSDMYTHDVSKFAAGNYIMNIQTTSGQKQVPFTVIK